MLAAHGPRGYALVAAFADGWSSYGGPASVGVEDEEFWNLVTLQSQALTLACESVSRDPSSVRRSLLLGYGALQPLASVPSYLRSIEFAESAGFDEVVVYWPWPGTRSGDRFWADPDVVASAVEAVRG